MRIPIAGKTTGSKDLLAADIGATKTNMAFYHWDGKQLQSRREGTYKTRQFTDVHSLVMKFVGESELPASICLAVAGPVQDNWVTMTNTGWTFSAGTLSEQFQRPVWMVNDLEATAYGLAVLDEKDIHLLHNGEREMPGNMAVIAPGTGLGEAGLFFDHEGYHPFATEGGHSSFAPEYDIDWELLHFLQKRFEHVSWERVLSGPGICAIFDFLVQVKQLEPAPWIEERILAHDKATVISENAAACPTCGKTIELFIRYLAQESAHLVLKLKATGGLFIGGGIIPHLLPLLHEDYFLKHFSRFGRLKTLLQSVPVRILMNEKTALLGAACFGIRKVS